ncbi:MAG: hypothetical protein A2Y69_03030 [Candidatus Aminicenantes bacterium RBG_13_59_9]|nr:MAG: hypothetical protein A2Y69_03030 [Candidatus Aminicenantes bacterium RBG_13_59_9]
MLNKHGFYDSRWHKSKTFKNKFERKYINSDLVVNDHATGLMWQHVASSDRKTFDDARNWIENLNQKGYAGYHDWRLPTLEEGASLIESSKKNFYLYIDPLFIGIQENMWTGDQYGPFDAWVVYFDEGNIVSIPLFDDAYVRVVRSEN